MAYKIPQNIEWRQNNDGDISGDISQSLNVDLLESKGAVMASPRFNITTDDLTNLGVPIGFVRFNSSGVGNGFYTIAGDRIFNTADGNPNSPFVATTGSVTTHSINSSDLIYFEKANKLVFAHENSVQSLTTGGTFATVAGTPLTGGSPHIMTEYAQRLYITDSHKQVSSFDTSMNSTLTGAPYTYNISTYDSNFLGESTSGILGASDRIWIFTLNTSGASGRAIWWDGSTQDEHVNAYIIDDRGIISWVLHNDYPYVMNTSGELLTFNGGAFVRVPNGRLPISKSKILKNSYSRTNQRWIHPSHGMKIVRGKIRILISNEYEDGTFEKEMPAGFYEFDLSDTSRGWYHVGSLSLYTGTGDITDWGQQRISQVGGFSYVPNSASNGNDIIAGSRIYSNATDTKEVVEISNTSDTQQKYASFITPKILSQNVEDNWTGVYARFERLKTADDYIQMKYRTHEEVEVEDTITWTSTTTFTSSTNLEAYVGYEVEVVQGVGSAKCSHITSVTTSDGYTWTVTVDETYTGATGTAKILIRNFIKIGTFNKQTTNFKRFAFGKNNTAPYVQLKCCMQFTGKNKLYDLLGVNSTNHKVV